MEKPIAVGIDLGTTYSCVAVIEKGKVEILTNDEGERITPSVVGFIDEDGQETIGDWPRRRMHEHPSNVISCAKRLIGRKYDDPKVEEDIKHLPFKIVRLDNGNAAIQVEFNDQIKIYTPEEISARVLLDLKRTALHYFGKEVTDILCAVITIPAYFTDAQRQATIDAAKLARINVLRLINEPTAAALAYGYKQKWDNGKILVYDLGGGTLDVSIIEVTNDCCKVLAVDGDVHLGGEDFDNILVKYCVEEFKRVHGDDISNDVEVVCQLKSKCEEAKRLLSKSKFAPITVKKLYDGKDLIFRIAVEEFNKRCKDLVERTLEPVKNVLKEAKLTKDDIKNVVLVGGSTRIPYIHEAMKEFFDGKKLNFDINPDEAVANGAAILAAHLSRDCDTLIKNIRLLDVIPRSLGIHCYSDTSGQYFNVVLKRYTRFPCEVKKEFHTTADNMTSQAFEVYEGEDRLVANNKFLGTFKLSNITRGPAKSVLFDVTFKVDENGILTVTATEISNGNSNSLTILQDKGRLTDAELIRMANELHTPLMEIDIDNH